MSTVPKKNRGLGLAVAVVFIIVALISGLAIGGYAGVTVIAPLVYGHQQNNSTSNTNNQNNNTFNNQNSNASNNNQNGNNNGGIANTNSGPTNPNAVYTGTDKQFSMTVPGPSGSLSGTFTGNVNCSIQITGSNILLQLSVAPQSVTGGLTQLDMTGGSPGVFNFAGTVTSGSSAGSQITAAAQGSIGTGDNSASFDLSLSGTFGTNSLTISVSTNAGSQISISASQITLQQM